jgi:hypothetical protein
MSLHSQATVGCRICWLWREAIAKWLAITTITKSLISHVVDRLLQEMNGTIGEHKLCSTLMV